jgi:uncharacterized protein YggE
MNNTFFGEKINRTLGTVVLMALVVALGSYAYYTVKQANYNVMGPTTISVTGEGEVTAIPDIGQFNFTVTASGTDAAIAQEESAKKINEVIAFLKEASVEEKDIKTSGYNLYPKYSYEQAPCRVGMYCPSEQVQDGFEVSQTVSVKVRDTKNSGALISGVGTQGATNISGIEFTIDDTSVLKDEARSIAIKDAKDKAKVLAQDLGVSLDEMVGYSEDGDMGIPYYSYGVGGDMMMKAESSPVEPMMPTGENTVISRVTITFKVN